MVSPYYLPLDAVLRRPEPCLVSNLCTPDDRCALWVVVPGLSVNIAWTLKPLF